MLFVIMHVFNCNSSIFGSLNVASCIFYFLNRILKRGYFLCRIGKGRVDFSTTERNCDCLFSLYYDNDFYRTLEKRPLANVGVFRRK